MLLRICGPSQVRRDDKRENLRRGRNVFPNHCFVFAFGCIQPFYSNKTDAKYLKMTQRSGFFRSIKYGPVCYDPWPSASEMIGVKPWKFPLNRADLKGHTPAYRRSDMRSREKNHWSSQLSSGVSEKHTDAPAADGVCVGADVPGTAIILQRRARSDGDAITPVTKQSADLDHCLSQSLSKMMDA